MRSMTFPLRPAAVGPVLLGIYLNDHLAAETASAQLAHRLAAAHRLSPDADLLREFAQEIDQDRTALLTIMDELEVPIRRYKVLAARAAEVLGRAKPNGRILTRSPLSDVLEVEALRLAVEGKTAVWRTLRARVKAHPRLDAAWLDSLLDRAERQADLLDEFRERAAEHAFGTEAEGSAT